MIELALSSRGVLVGWAHGGWACWAHLKSHRALRPEWSHSLGSGLAARPVVEVGWHRATPVALHADRDHAELVVGPPGQGRRVALPGRDPLAFASDGDAIVAMTTQPEGLGLTRVPLAGEPGAWELVLPRRDLKNAWLHRFFNGFVLVAGLERALAVVTLAPDLSVRATVRTPLAAPLEALHCAEAGNGLALALTYEGGDRVDAARIDAAGTFRERPHPVLRGAHRSPRVHWDEHGFRISAQTERGALVSRRLGGEPQTLMERIGAPFAIGHDYGDTVAATIEGHALSLQIRDAEHMVRPAAVDLTPTDAPSLEHARRTRALGERWARLRARGGYRGGDASMQWDPARLEAVFPAAGGAPEGGLRFRFERRRGQPLLVITFGEPGEAAPEASWARLVGWVRKRFSSEAREAEARARALAAPIVGEALPEGARLQSLGEAVLLELPLEELPDAETLDGWVKAILRAAHDAQGDASD